MTVNCWKFKGEKSKRWGSLRRRRPYHHHLSPSFTTGSSPMTARLAHRGGPTAIALFELRVYQRQDQRIRIAAGPSKESHFPFCN